MPFGRAVERHAHAIEQIDDPGRPVGHFQHRRLIGQEIAAEHGLIEMLPLAVALLAGDFVAGIDAALGADAVAALDRHHGKQIDRDAFFGQFDRAGQSGQSAADDNDTFFC